MIARILIVILLVLNVSVFIWWITRSPVNTGNIPTISSSRPSLQLMLVNKNPSVISEITSQTIPVPLPKSVPSSKSTSPSTEPTKQLTPPDISEKQEKPLPNPLPEPLSEEAGVTLPHLAPSKEVANISKPIIPKALHEDLSSDSIAPPTQALTDTTNKPALSLRCTALGPFDSVASAQAAQSRISQRVHHFSIRQSPSKNTGSTYRVILLMPPENNSAQALLQQVTALGISDAYIINSEGKAPSIGLGAYRQHDGARRRVEQLKNAGLNAQIFENSIQVSEWWLDIAAEEQYNPASLRKQAQANQQKTQKCVDLR